MKLFLLMSILCVGVVYAECREKYKELGKSTEWSLDKQCIEGSMKYDIYLRGTDGRSNGVVTSYNLKSDGRSTSSCYGRDIYGMGKKNGNSYECCAKSTDCKNSCLYNICT